MRKAYKLDASENQKAVRQYRPTVRIVAVDTIRDKGLVADSASPQNYSRKGI